MTTKAKKKVKKIALKKTSRVSFNKKNAIEFGKQLYNESNKQITYMKLACEILEDNELHCAIGEAYCYFVNPKLNDVFKIADKIIWGKNNEPYNNPYQISCGDPATVIALNKLVEIAQLKNKSLTFELATALEKVIHINDDKEGDATSDLAFTVAMAWSDYVVPLLNKGK